MGPASMARPYSVDLRERVVKAVDGGLSRRQAASLFGVAISTVIEWVRVWRETGSVAARPMGREGFGRPTSTRVNLAFATDPARQRSPSRQNRRSTQYRTRFEERIQAECAEFASDARLLEAAEWGERLMRCAIDDDASGLQLSRHPLRMIYVGREHVGLQPVAGALCHPLSQRGRRSPRAQSASGW